MGFVSLAIVVIICVGHYLNWDTFYFIVINLYTC